MGQGLVKRALVTKHPSVYETSVLARKYRHDFEALHLSEEQVGLMWDEYCKIDEDKSGEISLWELFEALDMKQSKFTKRIFRIFDEDGSGSVDFREFVMSLWNYCTLSKAALIMFAFDLYDNDNSGEIDLAEVELLLKETQMQVKILGSKFWLACSNARVKISSGEYVNIAEILQAHVNEKAFKDLVDAKEAVPGKPSIPSASADNVAMLQVSGTLANRRLLRSTINTHMTTIQAMAKNVSGPNAGSIQPMQRERIATVPSQATTPRAEGRKVVSWGTVKTHKVYVIDSDGGDDGKEVVEPGIETQAPPEPPTEVTALSTEPQASASPASGAVVKAARTKLISPGASHKALTTRQESRPSAASQKTSTSRTRPSPGVANRSPLLAEKSMSARRKTPARGISDGSRR